MAWWYPESGITWSQYLQANSFVKDIKKEVSQSGKSLEFQISNQTMQIVASNAELSRAFGQGFDSVNKTLRWGFRDVEFAIDKLHADFNYNMGLLIEQFQIQNKLFEDLLDKLDQIHKTLESPLLTQARELYRIGCERVNKNLLDKALKAFLEAEKKNDTDFFIQYHIGMLYLYGIDEDDNIVDLQKAKEHLLRAVRYAKAEISVDPTFSQYAAESLLHVSIANYARLEEYYKKGDQEKITQLLTESKEFVTEAVNLYPQLLEARYHLAKYKALLSEGSSAIVDLQTVVEHDRNYALKTQGEKVFDNIRPQILSMLGELKTNAKKRFEETFRQARSSLRELETWYPEKSSTLSPQYEECKSSFNLAKEYSEPDTYFGYLDALPLAESVIQNSKEVQRKRINELSDKITKIINSLESKFHWEGYSEKSDKAIEESKKLIEKATTLLDETSYESYQKALSIYREAHNKASLAEEHAKKVKRNREIKDEDRREKKRRRQARLNNMKSLATMGTKFGVGVGGLLGCGACIMASEGGGFAIEQFFKGILGGLIAGWLLGGLIGFMARVEKYGGNIRNEYAESLFKEGTRLYEEARFSEAQEKLEEALTLLPNSEDIMYNLALVYLQSKKHDQAFRLVNQIKEIDCTEIIQELSNKKMEN